MLALNVFTLQDKANYLFKQVYKQKSLKIRANDAFTSACLYIACRQEGVARTLKGQSESLFFCKIFCLVSLIILKQFLVLLIMW